MLRLLFLSALAAALPVVDKGVFVITGVATCRSGTGFCILGTDCTVDKEFGPDPQGGHCDGLRKAFTPRAYFVCCQAIEEQNVTTTVAPTTLAPSLSVETVESKSEASSAEESDENSVERKETTIIYDQATEISVDVNVELQKCARSRVGHLASQTPSRTCHAAAFVRSPTTMSIDSGAFICSGALIHPRLVLTSATCVSRFHDDLRLFRVAFSKHLLHPANGPTAEAQYLEIEKIVVHEGYALEGHRRFNDIALVRLQQPANLTSVCLACLPEKDEEFIGHDCIVTGFSHPPSDSTESDGVLHEAEQRIEPKELCEETFGNVTEGRSESSEGLVCASSRSQEACFSPRDVGSPLTCERGGVEKLAGLFSSGFHCSGERSGVLYTDVVFHRRWLLAKLSSNSNE